MSSKKYKTNTMKNKVLTCVLAVLIYGCDKKDDSSVQPTKIACLNTKIKQFQKSDNLCKTTASVKQYSFQNKRVFVFDLGDCCADCFYEVYDDQCNLLGNLGGFPGYTKINNVPFYDSAVFVKTVWNN